MALNTLYCAGTCRRLLPIRDLHVDQETGLYVCDDCRHERVFLKSWRP